MKNKPPGRPKGRKNLRTILVEETAMKLGCDPFKILCLFANGDWEALGYDTSVEVCESAKGSTFIKHTIAPELRANCAKEAAKYLYSQKQSVELSGEVGISVTVKRYLPEDK